MRRRLIGTNAPFTIALSDTVVGDVLFYDRASRHKGFFSVDDVEAGTIIPNTCVPIGVVVIPASHDVYGDGGCAVMSLHWMNTDMPTTGSYWMYNSSDIEYPGVFVAFGTEDDIGLPYFTEAPHIGNVQPADGSCTIEGTLDIKNDQAYTPVCFPICGGYNCDETCLHDTRADYFHSAAYYDNYYYGPSPFLNDGSRNPAYYQTRTPSSTRNVFSDFDGRGNTNKILAVRGGKNYNSWKPSALADFPAVSCCDMYHTEGTKQGDWYLPATGEAGYMIRSQSIIYKTLYAIDERYLTIFSSNYASGAHEVGVWTSTQYSSDCAVWFYMNLDSSGEEKSSTECVKAFCQINQKSLDVQA